MSAVCKGLKINVISTILIPKYAHLLNNLFVQLPPTCYGHSCGNLQQGGKEDKRLKVFFIFESFVLYILSVKIAA